MRLRFAIAVTGGIAAAVLVACNALTGVGDLDATGAGDGILRDEAGRPIDAAGLDGGGGLDGTTGDIAVSPSLAACGTERVCLTSAKGWVPAAFPYLGFGPGATCPQGYPQRGAYQRSGGGGCSCNCSTKSGSCAGTIEAQTGAACAGSPVTISPNPDGGCTPILAPAMTSASITPKPPNAPSVCDSAVLDELAAPLPAVACTGAAPIESTACQGDEICVPKPSGSVADGVLTCIIHDGDVPCPPRLVFRIVVGTSIDDQRRCGASCSCRPNGCMDGKVETFENEDCSGNSFEVTTDSKCKPIGASVESFTYAPGTGCGVDTPAQVVGNEVVSGARTLCCAFPFGP